MSGSIGARGRIGVIREPVPCPADLGQIQRDRIAQRVDGFPLLDGVLLVGLKDTAGNTTDGITFAAGQSMDLSHGLGRAVTGVMVADSQGAGVGQVVRNQAALTSGLDAKQFVHVTNVGASTTTVKLWVW